MLAEIKTKIRGLIEDLEKSGFEYFTYTTSAIFRLAEENITSLTSVLLNGEELETGEYSFDSDTNKITITVTGLSSSDIIEVNFKYYKYSDTELQEFIRSALVWISMFGHSERDYELEDNTIYPVPENRDEDLIALIASILIKPDYTTYRLPTVTVIYGGRMPKDQKIQKLLSRYTFGLGITGVLEFDD